MKKLNFIKSKILLLSILFSASIAQGQGLYLNVGGGYNLSAGSQMIGINYTSTTAEAVYGSLGKGISFGAGLGYMFSENIGAELGFSYLSGAEFETNDFDTSGSSAGTASGKMIRINPSLKLTAGEGIKPYAKFGIVLGLGTEVTVNAVAASPGFSYTEEIVYTEGMALGWSAAFGLDFPLSDKIAIFAEANLINQTWKPKKLEYTATGNGFGFNFSESETYNLEEEVNFNSSNTDLSPALPFSSIGLHAGIKIMLSQ